MFLMAFGLFTTWAFHGPWYVWLVGFVCAAFAPRWVLMLFGIWISIILNVPAYVWVIGFLCICADMFVSLLAAD